MLLSFMCSTLQLGCRESIQAQCTTAHVRAAATLAVHYAVLVNHLLQQAAVHTHSVSSALSVTACMRVHIVA
jgi:hypothetical protein